MTAADDTVGLESGRGGPANPRHWPRPIRSLALASIVGVAALALAGCVVGDTDPATGVTADGAQLNGHGRTVSGGPDYWWWEYATSAAALGTASDVEVCESEPDNRCGPASTSTDQKVSTPLTGLKPDTTYHFRFCTQDRAPGSPQACYSTLSFKTLEQNYVLDRRWGSQGSGDGQFSGLGGVATDTSGNVYVADAGNHRIQKFDSSGRFLAKWGNEGSGDGQFSRLGGIAADTPGNVYVADNGNYRVEKFDSSGRFLAKWGSQGSADGEFSTIGGIAADSSGSVYVADAGNHRIQKFSSPGRFITKWGSQGSGDGQFFSIGGVAADGSGNVYVADNYEQGNPAQGRIQKFDSSGSFIAKWANDTLTILNDVATDSSGAVFANRIEGLFTLNVGVDKYSSSGSLLARWSTKTVHCGFFGGCDGDPTEYVAADRFGDVYIADVANSRIEKFAPAQ